MRLAWLIGWKDCLVRFQNRTVLMFVVIMPLAMTLATGYAFKGLEAGSITARVALIVEDASPSQEVQDALEGMRNWPPKQSDTQDEARLGAHIDYIEVADRQQASAQVEAGELHGAIVVPQGFSEALEEDREAKLELIVAANPSLQRSVVESAIDRLTQVLKQGNPRPVVATMTPVGERQKLRFNSFSQAVAGNGVVFIIMNCMTSGGVALVRERRQNTLARLMIAPVGRGTLIFGKTIGVYIVGLVQAILVFGFGAIFWGIFKDVDVLAVALVTLLVILVGCSLGMLLSAIARREETVEALSAPVALLMTALGGGMFPLELGPAWLKQASFFLPTGWAMDGYHQLLWLEGTTLTTVLPHLGVLSAFAAVFFALGVWFLRWE